MKVPDYGGRADFVGHGDFTVEVNLYKDVTGHLKTVIEKDAAAG